MKRSGVIPWMHWLQSSLLSLLVTVACLSPETSLAHYDLKDNAILHARQGQLFLERQQYFEAIEEFKAAIRLNPYASMAAPLYNNLGLAYRAVGDYALSIVSFQRASRIQPNYAVFYRNMIQTYKQAGRLHEAEQAFRATLAINRSDAEAWFLLGLLYQEQEQAAAANACFQHYLKLQPESDLAHAARQALQ